MLATYRAQVGNPALRVWRNLTTACTRPANRLDAIRKVGYLSQSVRAGDAGRYAASLCLGSEDTL